MVYLLSEVYFHEIGKICVSRYLFNEIGGIAVVFLREYFFELIGGV